jgi:hypothetical protein
MYGTKETLHNRYQCITDVYENMDTRNYKISLIDKTNLNFTRVSLIVILMP